MCLIIDYDETKRIERRFKEAKKKGKDYIICYKDFDIDEYTDELISPYYSMKYNPGWNISDRESNKINDREHYYGSIDRGIHVYTNRKAMSSDSDLYLIECRCYKKDFVSGGLYKEAVFTKVFITKDEYKKSILKKKERNYGN